jgi:lipopolysaccharide export LptBFGC system permease protein LptF
MRASARSGSVAASAIPLEARNEFITRQRIETEISKRKSFAQQILRYQVEIHKKYSIPFACLIFVLVGAPLAIRMGRSGMNMAIGLSLAFFLIYYVGLIGGEKLADRGITSPFVAMWSPNILFGVIAVLLLRKAAREQAVSEWSIVSLLKSIFRRNAVANS